jgi:hypothetical protein
MRTCVRTTLLVLPGAIVRLAPLIVTFASVIEAQQPSPIRRWEFGVDGGWFVNGSDGSAPLATSPVSVRYGVVNSAHRLTLDQRFTFRDQRATGAPSSWAIETQLGWRLGGATRVHRTVFGPYTFGAVTLRSARPQLVAADRGNGPLFGFSGGFGSRVSAARLVLRPEMVLGYDFGAGFHKAVEEKVP